MELISYLKELAPFLGWGILAFLIFNNREKLYKELVFDPLSGGNGKVQMDELAKGIILGVFIACVYVEATRKTEHHVFSDSFYFALLASVCAIAAIKPIKTLNNNHNNDRDSKSDAS